MSYKYRRRRELKTSLISLCPICLDAFVNTHAYVVQKAHFSQKEMDTCCYCQSRRGWDYIVLNKLSHTTPKI